MGVVKSLSQTSNVYADIFIPLVPSPSDLHDFSLVGGATAILLLDSKADIPKMKEEFNRMTAGVPIDDQRFDRKLVYANTYLQSFTREIHAGFTEDADGGVAIFLLIIGTFFLFSCCCRLLTWSISISAGSWTAARKSASARHSGPLPGPWSTSSSWRT